MDHQNLYHNVHRQAKRKQASAFINIPVTHRALPGQHHRTALLLEKVIFLHIITAAEQAIAHLKENKYTLRKKLL